MSYVSPTSESESSRPFQFTLRQIALSVLGICFLLALVFHWGIWGAVVTVVVAAIVALCYATYYGHWWGLVPACFLMAVGAAYVVGQAPEPHRIGPRRPRCENNLKQIGIALHSYHEEHGCFPPPYLADASGKPMHSWRVLLLPYMDGQHLYERYRFDEPWNGPNNSKLAGEVPYMYRCADVPPGSTTATAYLAVVGATTMWPASGTVKLDDITDGTDQTLAVVEVENSGVNWLEPRDLQLAPRMLAFDSRRSHGIQSAHRHEENHQSGTWAVFADGSVRFMGNEITAEKLRALLTIHGGDNARFQRE